MRVVQRRTPPPAETPYCSCAKPFNGFREHPDRPGWWVAGCCDRPAKTYLDAKEEQGHEW